MNQYVMLSRRTFFALLLGTCLSFLLTLNLVHQVAAKEGPSEDAYKYLRTFTDVIGLVEKNYVKEINFQELMEGAIKGMLLSLDPHSSYMTPDTFKELQVETKGEFGGLGIEIVVKDGLLTVVAPIEESPAARAGIHPGDQIIKIGEEFTRDLSLVDAVKKMRGPKGSPITLSVHREGIKDLLNITVVRDIIKVKSVRSRMLDDGFGYVRLAQFQEQSADEFVDALKDLEKKSKDRRIHGLVIDLRNDPGGLLQQAIRVADIFLEDGVIVYTDGRLESQKQKYYAHDDGNEPSYPIVVLVNGGSASASEIVAGAFQDHQRALILGEQTFGKGSVQTILPMDNGAALRLTTALYYTKNGRSIQAQGVTPDVIVSGRRFPKDTEEVLEADEGYLKEKDLPHAIQNPNLPKNMTPVPSNENSVPQPGARPGASRRKDGKPEFVIGSRAALEMSLPELLKEDPQLDEALRLLKTWHVFKGKPVIQAAQENAKQNALAVQNRAADATGNQER